MKALRFEGFGAPADVLKLLDTADDLGRGAAPLANGEVRVRIDAAGINPSDVANIGGKFPNTTLPRVPGRDFAGTVIAGPSGLIGVPVWGSGGDLGFTRDGSHAEFLNLPATSVSRRPGNLSAEEAAAAGVPYVTAWTALELARLEAGEWILVSGAAGAVGSAAIDLAHARGARVLALVKDDEQAQRLEPNKVSAVALANRNDLEQVARDATGGKGVNVILNGIGASVFPAFLNALADLGRMVIYSVTYGGREVPLDLFALYRRRHQLLGLNTGTMSGAAGAQILAQLTPLFESGALPPPRVAERYPLAEGVRAYERVAAAQGKVVLVTAGGSQPASIRSPRHESLLPSPESAHRRGKSDRRPAVSPSKIIGVDGCHDGWMVATSNPDLSEIAFSIVPNIHDIIELAELNHAVVAIDVPIGLPDHEPRSADLEARKQLGKGQSCRVFPVPARAALAGESYESACALNREALNRSLSKQTWGIIGKIRDVDSALDGVVRSAFYEVHPEVSFAVAHDEPLKFRKADKPGRDERLKVLRRHGIEVDLEVALRGVSGASAKRDDAIDAAIALWTAARLARGDARSFGTDPPDARGRPMRIWA
ncbi:MAG TPA: DUF429 domain-containing protein [Terriglobales bacterium]|jgi:NADPH:quinone reductase-like Zn-dependent oxidoreductase/predicted RNase H-like nuclease